ncbi:DUF378 domain-containing protein [Bacillus sp. Bva_UNVM-123]|uniref:DUF378 domain-containing protein n=1 Tax=Bacillus sp. Bva_UNVM-123 TaxID=2829798 RepID=UPI00391F18BD
MTTLRRIVLALTIIGAINWGLIGFFQFDLVAAIFGGQTSFLSRVIYGLVGLSGLACITLLFEPIREDNKVTSNHRFDKPSYGTEFGEETDLSDLNRSSSQVNDQNKDFSEDKE